jgi:hypothetical protein
MEILALRLFVPEDEVNALLTRHLPPDVGVNKLTVRLTPEGIHLSGEYPTVFMKVAFETLWAVGVRDGRLEARLANVKVAGLPAAMLRGVLMKVLQDAAREPGVSVDGESLLVSPEEFLLAKGLPLRVNLTEVVCSLGSLLVRSGRAAE